MADTWLHGTTHEIPHERFAREQVLHRTVATDCLLASGRSRYSVPKRYVGESVVIQELLLSYEILHQGTVIARHRSVGRHQVVQEPAHYTELLRPQGSAPADHRATPL